MLDNIKSLYFIKIIFSIIVEKRKLKIVKYNKKMQNNININLINYKSFTNKYIIYEDNGIGKEFNSINEKLIFEGEYKHGKKNGKGKDYFVNGNLEFEGEYLNGKRNGKGKEFCYNGYKIFEGEYLNGKKWNGKGYELTNIIYELKDGKGLIEYFKGEYKNGEINGKVKEYYKSGKLEFEGEYLNGKKWNGKGYNNNNNQIIYELKDGKGYIKEYNNFGRLLYEGEYLNGRRNGKGKEYSDENGHLIFEGEFLDGKRHGKGKEFNIHSKLIFEGQYLYGNKRKGKSYINGILEYEGEYLYDKKYNGKGFDKNGNIIY